MIDLEIKDMRFAITEYISIEKQYLLDAKKYMERAQKYLDEGKAAHCAGCLAKAAKKLHRYNQYKSFSDDLIMFVMKPMLNSLADKVADNFLKGT